MPLIKSSQLLSTSQQSNTTIRILKMIVISNSIEWCCTWDLERFLMHSIPVEKRDIRSKACLSLQKYKNCGCKVWIGVSACHSHPWSFPDLQNQACCTRPKVESSIFGYFLKSISLNFTYPPVLEWINKLWSSHTMECYSTLKKWMKYEYRL